MSKLHQKTSSAYIHVPFCRSKCFYCDFNSFAGSDFFIEPYFDAILKEIDMSAHLKEMDLSAQKSRLGDKSHGAYSASPLQTIFIGGGTPTYVSPNHLAAVLHKLEERFGIDPDCEITMECNPGTVDDDKIRAYKEIGINRISIGLQSASDRLLTLAGRTHTRSDFEQTVRSFQQAGFENINVDLIEGLPGQELADLIDSLNFVVDFTVQHLSLYSLSIEAGTPFYNLYHKNEELLPDARTEREMYHSAIELLTNAGYEHYEISNFAKPGYQSRHNVRCWKGESYYGFGSGAHSYLNGVRFSNISGIKPYIDSVMNTSHHCAVDESIVLREEDIHNEYFMLGLRLTEGVSATKFARKFGKGFDQYLPILNKLISQGLLVETHGTYQLSEYGLDYANKVFIEFV